MTKEPLALRKPILPRCTGGYNVCVCVCVNDRDFSSTPRYRDYCRAATARLYLFDYAATPFPVLPVPCPGRQQKSNERVPESLITLVAQSIGGEITRNASSRRATDDGLSSSRDAQENR